MITEPGSAGYDPWHRAHRSAAGRRRHGGRDAELVEHAATWLSTVARRSRLVGYLGVGVALADQAQHVDLTGGKARRVARVSSGGRAHLCHAQVAQAGADPGRQRPGAELVEQAQRDQQLVRVVAFAQRGGPLVGASGTASASTDSSASRSSMGGLIGRL